jgi:hypothetical protein
MDDPQIPPGWHDDPHDPTSLRYWDGTQWTDQRAPKQTTPPATAGAENFGWSPPRIAAVVGVVAIIVGSISPWATIATAFGTLSVNGTDGDGVITIAGGIVLLVLIGMAKYLGSIIVSALTGAVLLYDLIDVNRNVSGAGNEFVNASVGWGLWVATIGGGVTFATSIVLHRAARAARRADQPLPPSAG